MSAQETTWFICVCVRLLHPAKQNGGVNATRGPEYIPVLVEATTALLGQMLGPDIDQGTQTEGSLDVADGTEHNHGRGLQNGDGLHDLLLVYLCKAKGILELSTCLGIQQGLTKRVLNQSALVIIITVNQKCSNHKFSSLLIMERWLERFVWMGENWYLLEPGRSASRTMCVMPAL